MAKEFKPVKVKSKRLIIVSEAYSEQTLWTSYWKICLKKNPDVEIGSMCFKGPQKKGKVELTFNIEEEYKNQGYATEAVKAVVSNWVFLQQDVYTVEAETENDNVAALKVLAKAGFDPQCKGETGPRFSKKKANSSWMSVYLCIGISVGMSLGNIVGKIGTGIGMAIGAAIGIAIGFALDMSEKKHRAEVEGKTDADAQAKSDDADAKSGNNNDVPSDDTSSDDKDIPSDSADTNPDDEAGKDNNQPAEEKADDDKTADENTPDNENSQEADADE